MSTKAVSTRNSGRTLFEQIWITDESITIHMHIAQMLWGNSHPTTPRLFRPCHWNARVSCLNQISTPMVQIFKANMQHWQQSERGYWARMSCFDYEESVLWQDRKTGSIWLRRCYVSFSTLNWQWVSSLTFKFQVYSEVFHKWGSWPKCQDFQLRVQAWFSKG